MDLLTAARKCVKVRRSAWTHERCDHPPQGGRVELWARTSRRRAFSPVNAIGRVISASSGPTIAGHRDLRVSKCRATSSKEGRILLSKFLARCIGPPIGPTTCEGRKRGQASLLMRGAAVGSLTAFLSAWKAPFAPAACSVNQTMKPDPVFPPL